MTKPAMWPVRPAKTHISLGIRPVWSESSLSAWRKLGSLATHWAHSEDSDQTGRMPRLIWFFAGRSVILLVLSWGGSHSLVHCRNGFAEVLLRKWASAQQNKQNDICTQAPEPSLFAHIKVWKKMKGPTKNQTSSSIGWLRMRVWRMSLQRTKEAKTSCHGSI